MKYSVWIALPGNHLGFLKGAAPPRALPFGGCAPQWRWPSCEDPWLSIQGATWKLVLVITFEVYETLRSYGEAVPPLPRPLFAPLWAALVDWSLVWWRSTLDASPARIIPWLCKVVSCFGCLIWVVSIGQVLHLSHFHAYPWVGVCLQVRNCSQHYPGSHGSTRDQLLAGMCCKISFLDKIIVVDVLSIVLNHETEWNGRSVTREVFVKVHSTLFSQMWVTQDTWWQN